MKHGQTEYYERMARQGALAGDALKAIERALVSYDFLALPEQCALLRDARQESMELRNALTDAVIEDFLPPLDRADILGITIALHAINSAAAEALGSVFALQIPRVPAAAQRLAQAIGAQAVLVEELTALLPKLKKDSAKVLRLTRQIAAHAAEYDDAYAEALRQLTAQGAQGREPLAWHIALAGLCGCRAACGRLADAVEYAVVRNQ